MIEGLVLDLNHFQRMINIQLAHLDMVTPIVGNLARKKQSLIMLWGYRRAMPTQPQFFDSRQNKGR